MRDFYFSVEELPGPIVEEEDILLKKIKGISEIQEEYKEKYKMFNAIFNPYRGVCSARYLEEWMG